MAKKLSKKEIRLANRRSGGDEFEEHFSALYGERWTALRESLTAQSSKVAMSNPFGLNEYNLDPGSLFPVRYLDLKPGMVMADLCASPGGKSIASIFSVGGDGEWFCNDLSPGRVARLKAVLHDCVAPEVLSRVHVNCGDGSRWGLRYKEKFDRVLVDAPCSGERHLIHSESELGRWSKKGSQRLCVRQHSLLCSGFDALKPGGRMVYSTCSIHHIENDGVISKLFKSRAGDFTVMKIEDPGAEATDHGAIVLPDVAQGAGPIYFAVVDKLS